MKVWAVVVDGKVDSLFIASQLATVRMYQLIEHNGGQLAVHLQEMVVHDRIEEKL